MAKRASQAADNDWDADGAPAAASITAAGGAKPAPIVEPKAEAKAAKPDPSCALPTCVIPPDQMLRQFRASEQAHDGRVLASLAHRYPAVKRILAERDALRAKVADGNR